MDLRLLYAIILSIFPISELRGGIPLAVIYANENNIPSFLVISLMILCNLLAIFIAFYFLDHVHKWLLKFKVYKKIFESYLKRIQNKVDKFEKQHSALGFLALTIFVAIPLPATGAWSGCLISWILKLDRKKSILGIGLGVIIAGILVSLGTFGVLNIFS